jgi:urea transport system ATP-binding protein
MNTLVGNTENPDASSISTASPFPSMAFKALNSLSFVIEPGELRAIIGPNGAGKTTMMDIITGKTRPDSGEVFFEGLDRSYAERRGGDRPAWHRPQVPEADGLRKPYRLGQSGTGAQPQARRLLHAVLSSDGRGQGAHRGNPRDRAPDQPQGRFCRQSEHGQKQWLEIGMLLAQEPEASAGRRTRRRHDGRRNGGNRRSC